MADIMFKAKTHFMPKIKEKKTLHNKIVYMHHDQVYVTISRVTTYVGDM